MGATISDNICPLIPLHWLGQGMFVCLVKLSSQCGGIRQLRHSCWLSPKYMSTQPPPPTSPPPHPFYEVVSTIEAVLRPTCLLVQNLLPAYEAKGENAMCHRVRLGFEGEQRNSVVQWHQLFFLFFGGCPTKNGLPQKGFPFFQGH